MIEPSPKRSPSRRTRPPSAARRWAIGWIAGSSSVGLGLGLQAGDHEDRPERVDGRIGRARRPAPADAARPGIEEVLGHRRLLGRRQRRLAARGRRGPREPTAFAGSGVPRRGVLEDLANVVRVGLRLLGRLERGDDRDPEAEVAVVVDHGGRPVDRLAGAIGVEVANRQRRLGDRPDERARRDCRERRGPRRAEAATGQAGDGRERDGREEQRPGEPAGLVIGPIVASGYRPDKTVGTGPPAGAVSTD